MGFSFGLHVQQDFDLPAMMASPEMQQIYGTVLEVGAYHTGVSPRLLFMSCLSATVADNFVRPRQQPAPWVVDIIKTAHAEFSLRHILTST
jgi:hypothetical protein